MSRHYCYFRNCQSGKPGCEEKMMIFHASKQMIDVWKQVLSGVGKKEFTVKDGICEKHFKDKDIKRTWKSGDISIPYIRPLLSKTAVPFISDTLSSVIIDPNIPTMSDDTNNTTLFAEIIATINLLVLPHPSWGIHIMKNMICINEIEVSENNIPHLRKQVTISDQLGICYYYKAQKIDCKALEMSIYSVHEIETAILKFHEIRICSGGPTFTTYLPGSFDCKLAYPDNINWRHNQCSLIVENSDCCIKCKTLPRILGVCKLRSKAKSSRLSKLRVIRHNREKVIAR